jgi:hypothetical protein
MFLATGLALGARAEVEPLPALAIDRAEVTVSGFSSGGYMAVQFHVANSARVRGAGIMAGGPYLCAESSWVNATARCMCFPLGWCEAPRVPQQLPGYISRTRMLAQQNRIDPLDQLARSRVWLFSGARDRTVWPEVGATLADFYATFIPAGQIRVRSHPDAGHGVPVDGEGGRCSYSLPPFINHCDGLDGAGELLAWLYPGLQPRSDGALGGRLIPFDQEDFISDPVSHGMWTSGWLYVPRDCEGQAGCRLHVAFHGCLQQTGWPGKPGDGKLTDFVARAGYNAWADTNRIVVLYPQASVRVVHSTVAGNVFACWDWWGDDDRDYALRSARQGSAVAAMIEQLARPHPPTDTPPRVLCRTSRNESHVLAGRAYTTGFWWFRRYRASGSGLPLEGGAQSVSSLRRTAPAHFEPVASCA